MKPLSLLLILLMALALCTAQTCELVNYNESNFDEGTQFYVDANQNTTDVLEVQICTCPADTIPDQELETCICNIANQTFNGISCACEEGQQLVNEMCVSCPYPCATCDSAGNCLQCQAGYAILGQSSGCVEIAFDLGYTFSDGDLVYECPGGCSVCTAQDCYSCSQGFYQSESDCLPCSTSSKCKACSDDSTCSGCYKGFYLSSSSTCLSCPSNCQACTESTCSSCISGYYANGNTCQPCSQERCTSCQSDLCSACKKGFTLTADNQCVSCLQGCSYCSTASINTCLGCATGYYDNGGLCTPCKAQCSACISSVQCTACSEGYRLNGVSCIASCIFPCRTCSSTNSASCLSCYGGYLLSGKACKPDLSCNDNSTCTMCPRKYYLTANSTCDSCGLANCINCAMGQNQTQCVRCASGYTLSGEVDGTCTMCPTPCLTCSTEVFCTSCASGYFKYVEGGVSTGQCLQCSAENGCKTCRISATNCITCLSGFTLQGSTCITNNYVDFDVMLDASLDSFALKINPIKDGLNSLIGNGRKRDQISLRTLVTGSVNMSGSINAPSQTSASSYSDTLATSLTQGTLLAGVEVQSASFTSASFIEEDKTLSLDAKTGLIVGLTILAAAVITLVVIAVLRSRKSQQYEETYGMTYGETEPNTKMKLGQDNEMYIIKE